MSYRLRFDKRAYKEWIKLDSVVKNQFKKKLVERLEQPILESSKVLGADNCYKIKLKSAGYRLVYQVIDNELVVLVLAVGKHERNAVYKAALKRV
ncbi:MAG: type II toxin-antitoxin system mRNA interferase toxin, RelE/StbE family [Methylophaga sp.]|nr:type II toxin-antitoxin system mRNA interferase toxin, RelE/StbE family [Methylophaga sp.]